MFWSLCDVFGIVPTQIGQNCEFAQETGRISAKGPVFPKISNERHSDVQYILLCPYSFPIFPLGKDPSRSLGERG